MAIELAKAYVQIIPSATGIKDKITTEMGGDVQLAGLDLGNLLGGKMVSAITSVISTAAIGKVISDSITAGGALEQSLGGIETLFKDAFETVKTNAEQAYKTVGLSANEYMEQSTSFAASLVSSVSDDTQAAAQLADIALRDMADNANKMGTPMESIQNAYQGLAKSNYTMIDNLKLGYGGTQAEMERLLADATALSGVEYELGNLADMYVAIHTIQEELGITGTTAEEAAGTLSGSFASMGAAWQNVMGSLALGDGLTENLEGFVATAETYLVDNLLPMVSNVVSNIPQIAFTVVPEMLSTGTELVQSLANGFVQGVPEFFSTALPQLLTFSEELRENAASFVDAGLDMITQLLNGVIAGLPQLFAYVPDIIINIAGIINDNAPKLLAEGVVLIVQLIEGVVKSIPLLIQNFGKVMEAVLAVISAVNWVSMGGKILTGIGNGIKSMGSNLLNAFKSGFSSGIKWITSLPSQALQWGKDLINSFIGGLTGKAGAAATVATAGFTLADVASREDDLDWSSAWTDANDLIADSTVEMAEIVIPQYTKTSTAATSAGTAAASAAKTVTKSMADLVKEEMAALNLSGIELPSAFDQQADHLASLEAAYTAAAEDVDKLTYLLNEEIKTSGAASEKSQYLYKQLETAKNTLSSEQKALDEYRTSLDTAKTAASGFADSINQTINAVSGFGDKLSSLGDKLGLSFLSDVGGWISDMAGGATTVIQFAASIQTLNVAMQSLKTALNAVKETGGLSVVTAGLSELIGADTDVIAPLVSAFQTGIVQISKSAVDVKSIVVGTFTSLKEPLSVAAKTISSALSGGLLSAFPTIYTAMATLVGTIGAAFEGMLTAISAALEATGIGIPAGLIVAAAAVALGISIAAIVSKLGGSFKPSTSAPGTSGGGGSSGGGSNSILGSAGTLWDYEKSQALPERKQRPKIEVNQYIYSQAQTAADLMREAQYEQERAVLQGV